MSQQMSTSKACPPRPFNLDRLDSLLRLDDISWRHDVDESLASALEMARFEAERRVQATYYVAVRSPYYNLHSAQATRTLIKIRELGHSLGLHLVIDSATRDASYSTEGVAAYADNEFKCIPWTAEKKLSIHCPPTGLLWRDIPGWIYAYGPEWQGHYYADSSPDGNRRNPRFAHGDPENDPRRPLQINLHPEHWFPDATDDHTGFYR